MAVVTPPCPVVGHNPCPPAPLLPPWGLTQCPAGVPAMPSSETGLKGPNEAAWEEAMSALASPVA